jgi:hypothetical protein
LAQLLTYAAQQRLSGHEADYIHATRDSTGNLSISCIGAAFERGRGETPAALAFLRNIAESVERLFPSRGRVINQDFMPPALTLSVRAGQVGRELRVSEMLDETRTHTNSEIFPLGQLLFTLVRVQPDLHLSFRLLLGLRVGGRRMRNVFRLHLERVSQDPSFVATLQCF